jgi:hypothetical protein
MEQLISKLRRDHPNLVFTAGEAHCWSPKYNQILYTEGDESVNVAGLLHELGHAHLGHKDFDSDLELLQKEVDAWQEALRLAKQYDIKIDPTHIQDCLDTYREWLFRRSRCPECFSSGVQQTVRSYICLNCSATWKVTTSRMRRPYRLQTKQK